MEEITYADKTREAMQRQEIANLKQRSPEAYLAGHNKGWNDGFKAGQREVLDAWCLDKHDKEGFYRQELPK